MSSFRTAFRLSLPVLGAYWFLGMTYGLLAANMGYSICVPVSMALLIYSGSIEFIALTLLLRPLSNPLLKLLLKLLPYLGCAEFTPVISITLVPQF